MTFPWTATVLTLAPDAFPGVLEASVIGAARRKGLWRLDVRNIRDHAVDRHRTVDGPPTGGGAGMVIRPDVAAAAIDAVGDDAPLIYLSPRGRPLTQARVRDLAAGPGATLFCGRFEGLDQRVIEARGLEEISIGDYVLAGGEVAAQVLIEACVRLLPGVLGNAESHRAESFEDGLLEHDLYTKPAMWEGRSAPRVLRSGDHAAIGRFRHESANETTRTNRPDLWAATRPEAGKDDAP